MCTLRWILASFWLLSACGSPDSSVANPARGTAAPEGPRFAAWLPGLTVPIVQAPLVERGWRCTGPSRGPVQRDAQGPTLAEWTCRVAGDSLEFTVTQTGQDERHLRYVTGQVMRSGNGPRNAPEVMRQFLEFLATLPYDGADRAAARAWVTATFPRSDQTAINGVRFQLWGNENVRGLSIAPEGAP